MLKEVNITLALPNIHLYLPMVVNINSDTANMVYLCPKKKILVYEVYLLLNKGICHIITIVFYMLMSVTV